MIVSSIIIIMRQTNHTNFDFGLSHFEFKIQIKKKMFRSSRDIAVMATVCGEEWHFMEIIKRFFKIFARLDFHPGMMNIVYHVYVHMCTFFISSGSLPCYRSYSFEYFWRVDYRNFERRQFLFFPFPRNFLRAFETPSSYIVSILPFPISATD